MFIDDNSCVITNSNYFFFIYLSYLGPLSFYNVSDEVRHGLTSTSVIIYRVCGKDNEIKLLNNTDQVNVVHLLLTQTHEWPLVVFMRELTKPI